jgi:D-lactate dehydratase / protein deglycase
MYALKPFIFYHHRAYYARPPLSIMPGRTWRDNGHKALCPLSLCHGPAALLSASKVDGAEFCYKGYSMVTFSDKTDAISPKIGYMPGPMPWLVQKALTDQGAQTLNTAEKGATHVDRELITGDSPDASNAVGLIAAPMMVTYAAKAEAAP